MNKKVDTVKKLDDPEAVMAEARKRRNDAFKAREAGGALSGQQLYADQREGYKRYWVNVIDGETRNLDKKLALGYHFVTDVITNAISNAIGSGVSQKVGVCQKTGAQITTYLMEIPQELWEENQRTKENVIQNKNAAALKTAKDSGLVDKTQGGSFEYVP